MYLYIYKKNNIRIRTMQPKTKDDAYMQFMQEMEGLL